MNSLPTGVGSGVYVTLSGLPLRFHFQWPFRPSGSGADFDVLHGDILLQGSESLHCLVAVQMTRTVREVVSSLDEKDISGLLINSLRKEADRKQLEFVKSPKRVP